MNLPARTHPLHDLLSQVAAFLEMQRVGKIGFLGEKAFTDVLAIAGPALLNTHHPKRLGVSRKRPGALQLLHESVALSGRCEEEKARIGHTNNAALIPLLMIVFTIGFGCANFSQHRACLWTLQRDGSQL